MVPSPVWVFEVLVAVQTDVTRSAQEISSVNATADLLLQAAEALLDDDPDIPSFSAATAEQDNFALLTSAWPGLCDVFVSS